MQDSAAVELITQQEALPKVLICGVLFPVPEWFAKNTYERWCSDKRMIQPWGMLKSVLRDLCKANPKAATSPQTSIGKPHLQICVL